MNGLVAIVVNYASGPRLVACVESLQTQVPPPERILVVDNASPDRSLEGLPTGVDVLRRSVNDGFAAALNEGLARSNEPLVLSLNPDTLLLPGCLAAARAALEVDHLAGSIALRVLQSSEPTRVDATGIGLTSRCGQLNWDHGLLEADLSPEPQTVLGPLGGAALWRRQALQRAGGFDSRYFLYWEDVDVALRLDRAGYTCRTAPAARILHEGSASTGRWSALNVFYMVRNHWPCLISTLPGRLLLRCWPALLLAPVRAALLYASRGRPGAAAAGLLCGAALVPAAIWRRRHLQRTGSGARTAARVAELMAAADSNRLRLKAEAPALVRTPAR